MKRVSGAVIAGGRSVRYGEPKALARVGGRRIVDRVIDALYEVVDDIVLIANDPAITRVVALPSVPDAVADIGALGGILTALRWAKARNDATILAVACDMPFLSPALLRLLVARQEEPDNPDAVLPESGGPRGIEPLCALYATTCLPAVEAAVARGDRRMIGFHDDIRLAIVPATAVRRFGDPARLFLNVNTPGDRDEAERLVRVGSSP
jgi:molybdenum cofactor guanylyltransferase